MTVFIRIEALVPGPIWDIPSWIWDMDHPKSKFRFGMHEIEISIWDIPGWIWDMVTFGLQHLGFGKL